MTTPPVEVQKYGQSIWYDNIERKLISSGELKRMIEEDGVLGVTSNPTIFEKAIGAGGDYDDAIKGVLDLEAPEIFERLAIDDILAALDLFMPVYERTKGRDGFVSLEVSPILAADTQATIAEAKRLFAAVKRPNLMIKIPATPAGIPAIEEAIAAGVNVNVTLIFSVKNYIEVAEAYIRGLERRLAAGQDVTHIASVASFFLSRIDTMVDKILENNIRAAQGRDLGRVTANNKLLGKAAIANAKAAYRRFQAIFYGDRFKKLREAGAQVQRPLWASTGTKNPAYPDTKYIDTLIGRDTVNTLPPAALAAFKDHGTVGDTLTQEMAEVDAIFDMLAEVGVDMDQVTARLQDDGVDAFTESFHNLIARVDARRAVLSTGVMERQRAALGTHADEVTAALKQLDADHVNGRIWGKDGSVWKNHGPTIAKIVNRLGWLDVAHTIDVTALKSFQQEMRVSKSGFSDVVLLGMGGSSLAPEVLSNTFGSAEDFPKLHVLDSTSPARIADIEALIDLSKTLFIVASKSGGTIEVSSFFKYFWEKTKNGKQFIAITDPETPLEGLAKSSGFRDIFINPPDIGGRYSALSYFGLVPAALLGIDLDLLLGDLQQMIKACAETIPAAQHPGMSLGAIIATLARVGRDKLTLYASPSVGRFGDWVEQLVAESLGKEGKCVIPVVGASIGKPHDFSSDRLFVYLKVLDDVQPEMDAQVRALREAGHPRVTLEIANKYGLAGEFFRWEFATAVAGALMQINPFDEPNVTEAKEATGRLLEHYKANGALPVITPAMRENGLDLYANQATLHPLQEMVRAHGYDGATIQGLLEALVNSTEAGDYFALLAYLPYRDEITAVLEDIRRRLRHVSRRAVTVGYGPRYLHSTGQMHKGGTAGGVFIQITQTHDSDLAIPGEPYTFGTLVDAQAAGDLETLQSRNRRVLRLHFTGDVVKGLEVLLRAIEKAGLRRA